MSSSRRPPERRYAGLTPQERRTRRRDALVEAAIELFGTRGFRHTSQRALIARSKVAKRYLDEEFDGLDALLVEVHGRLRARLEAETLHRLRLDGAPDALLLQTTRIYVQAFTADPRVARIMLVEVLGVSERVEVARQRMVDEFVALMIDVHPDARRVDVRDPLRARLVATGLVGALYDLLYRWTRAADPAELDRLVDTWVLMCHGAWARALDPRPGAAGP